MVHIMYNWLAMASDVFVFDTPKKVRIQDWRLVGWDETSLEKACCLRSLVLHAECA